jgi:glutathione S-transferase
VDQPIILHHYWNSPFSEKVRLLFGIKDLAWRGVIQPVIMPKPDLIPLTGGYRRIPVMQIGADVFLDSAAIMAEIERRHPEPRVIGGADWALNAWADRVLFQPVVAIIFGAIGGAIDPAFVKDREAMSGRPFDAAAMKAAGPAARGQFRAALAWLEDQLGARGPYVGGEKPSLGDIAFWLNVWFYGNVLKAQLEEDLAPFPGVAAWRDRLRAIGCGTHTEMSCAEALAIAAASEPAALQMDHDPADPSGLSPGAPVTVSADDYGRDPIAGSLVGATPQTIVISRQTPELGRLNLHFPRAGYVLSGA